MNQNTATYLTLLKQIKDNGVKLPNGTIEVINAHVAFVSDGGYIKHRILPGNDRYINHEIDWYLSQDRCIKNHMAIEDNTIWSSICDKDGFVNSNYGWCVFSRENGFQYENAVNALIKDQYTRQSMCIYTRPSMHFDAFENGRKDFICTPYTQHFIRANELIYIVNMRSNDVVYGMRNNLPWHMFVYNKMLMELKKTFYPQLNQKGPILWCAGSLHIYEKHWHILDEL